MKVDKIRFLSMEQALEAGLPLRVSGYGLLCAHDATAGRITLAGDRSYCLMLEQAAWQNQRNVSVSQSPFYWQTFGYPEDWMDPHRNWKPVPRD